MAVPVGPGDHLLGQDATALTLVEYGDYECSFCGDAFTVVKDLQRALNGSLRFVFRNMPLADIHPNAEHAAEFAEAVGMLGNFWPMHDLLYENQGDLAQRSLLRYAQSTGADPDPDEVTGLIAGGSPRRRVHDDLAGGIRSGVNGTPTFFVNGLRYAGSWEFEPFHEYLQTVLDNP